MSASGPASSQPPPETGAHPFEEIVARLAEVAEAEAVTLRELIEAGGETSFVPALMIPAVIVVSPLSGIPLLPSIFGLTIALIAVQMVFGRRSLWLPHMLMTRPLKGARVRAAMGPMTRLARWIDRHSHDRLRPLTALPLRKLFQALAILCGLAMPFLELVPFSSSILGLAVLFFSAGFLSRDGVYILGGVGFMGVAAMVPLLLWLNFSP